MGKSSNACDTSDLTSFTEGPAIGRFTDGAIGCGEFMGWLEKGIEMYNTTTKLLVGQTKQHNEGKSFKVNLRAQLCNVTRMESRSRDQISATNDINNL